jgi:sporulation protein YlmC with PRC-barrel domain
MGADTLIGEDVYNHKDEDLGDIKEIMLDMNNGKIAYAVLSLVGSWVWVTSFLLCPGVR